jgi:ketosteroid isomerase-like protein
VRDLVERFVNAFELGDIGAILALLAEDATFSMPPHPGWCRGREAIADSWLLPGGPAPRLRYVPTRARVHEGGISEMIAFRSLEGFSRFGLPGKLPP